jgi:hypothetical protein
MKTLAAMATDFVFGRAQSNLQVETEANIARVDVNTAKAP